MQRDRSTADSVRAVLALEGGLVGRSDLCERWTVSRQRVAQLVAEPSFPDPVSTVNGGAVWLASDVDLWRACRPGPGRPVGSRSRSPVDARGPRVPPLWMRVWVLERDEETCRSCGATEDLQIDHVVPWSAGGRTEPGNLQVLCRLCNVRKGASVDGVAA